VSFGRGILSACARCGNTGEAVSARSARCCRQDWEVWSRSGWWPRTTTVFIVSTSSAGGGHAGRRHRNIDRAIQVRGGLHGTASDLGCGTGLHATAYLVEQGFDVVGVDSSSRSIEAARVREPLMNPRPEVT
jgi:hypothetical protein